MMSSKVISGISSCFQLLFQSQGQVTHVLLTRSPLVYPRRGLTVRLACVKHAASVRPEPGSNSPLMNNTTPHPNPRRNPSQAVPTSRRTRTPERALRSWLHECTRKESSISTKGIAREDNPNTHPERQTPSHPHETRIKIGIDFWHAVEFSRSGRTPTRRLSATRRGNPSSLDPYSRPVKPPARAVIRTCERSGTPSRGST